MNITIKQNSSYVGYNQYITFMGVSGASVYIPAFYTRLSLLDNQLHNTYALGYSVRKWRPFIAWFLFQVWKRVVKFAKSMILQ